ncbi:hypothetical protein F2Q68_00026144 [Brassica cretica]|uniref:Uncharacterized protein n=1 Tax=Brassica cretica TaxID=69181 RepID=A0A8S9IH02_BRACR|nr:hypothetical protein F2Q68_00026144 [Brassica cretica]
MLNGVKTRDIPCFILSSDATTSSQALFSNSSTALHPPWPTLFQDQSLKSSLNPCAFTTLRFTTAACPLQVLCLSLFPHLSYATSGDPLCPFKMSIAPIYSTCMKNLAFKA